MGRRPPRDRFMPDVWVFPGGRVEAEDARLPIARPMRRPLARRLEARWPAPRVRALATAAIRETWEETGLALGAVAGEALRPDHAPLAYLGRAITPTVSPIRYHARFFMASFDAVSGRLRGNGELVDLEWFPLRRALELPIIDVTTEILGQVQRVQEAGTTPDPVFVHYRGGARRVRRE
jgi:8-oxo-dGTP pyrophosphatase MutT (NUDIX family)